MVVHNKDIFLLQVFIIFIVIYEITKRNDEKFLCTLCY